MSKRFHRRSGVSAVLSAAVLALGGCNYGFQGGGGFPADIRTVYVAAFENRTTQFDLDQQIFRKIQERVPRALGVRPGGREIADAVIEGTISQYQDVAHNATSASGSATRPVEVLTHQVQIVLSVRIVDLRRNEILWESTSVRGTGEYRVDTQRVEIGRDLAIESIVQQIIDGAQSQW